MVNAKKSGGFKKRKIQEKIFYWSVLIIPIIQFCIFYLGVNFNSILLAMQKIELSTDGNGYIHTWIWFENFKNNFKLLFTEYELIQSFKNSILVYAISLLFGSALSLLFSYYIYKKKFMHNFFKITLFLPSIISSVTMIIIFKYFVENAYPALVSLIFKKDVEGLLANSHTAFGTILFYGIWSGFGGSILMYLSAMNSIPESIVEAAYLDGITPLKEFFLITLPLIYPTFVVLFITGIPGIFTNQMNLFTFYDESASKSYYTYGYYLFLLAKRGEPYYPNAASLGLIFTLIAAPLTFGVRRILEKYGPSVN